MLKVEWQGSTLCSLLFTFNTKNQHTAWYGEDVVKPRMALLQPLKTAFVDLSNTNLLRTERTPSKSFLIATKYFSHSWRGSREILRKPFFNRISHHVSHKVEMITGFIFCADIF